MANQKGGGSQTLVYYQRRVFLRAFPTNKLDAEKELAAGASFRPC